MTKTNGKAAARAYFEQVLNGGDMAAADENFSPDIRFHYPLGELTGGAAVKSYIEAVRRAFPDIHFAVADYVGEADRVAARWQLTGTQTGAFKGRAPTNNKVNVPGITFMSVKEGRIEEMWIAFDPARLIGG
jgi:steroid delta-isomerase-like uncharacterized protein